MFQYKNFYFRLLSPNGTSEIGVKFELSSADAGFSASDAGVSEQLFLMPLQPETSPSLPASSVVMDFGDA